MQGQERLTFQLPERQLLRIKVSPCFATKWRLGSPHSSLPTSLIFATVLKRLSVASSLSTWASKGPQICWDRRSWDHLRTRKSTSSMKNSSLLEKKHNWLKKKAKRRTLLTKWTRMSSIKSLIGEFRNCMISTRRKWCLRRKSKKGKIVSCRRSNCSICGIKSNKSGKRSQNLWTWLWRWRRKSSGTSKRIRIHWFSQQTTRSQKRKRTRKRRRKNCKFSASSCRDVRRSSFKNTSKRFRIRMTIRIQMTIRMIAYKKRKKGKEWWKSRLARGVLWMSSTMHIAPTCFSKSR